MGTSNGLGPSPIEAPLASRAPSCHEKTAKVSDEEAVKWASLLVHSLSPDNVRRSLGLKPKLPAQTGDHNQVRQPHDFASGTPAPETNAVTQSQLADTDGVNEAVPDRLILNVDSETLGRVQLIVDREEGGVRVLVGSDPGARNRLSEGKHAISEALSAAGVRVGALRFVTLNEVGTVLAQDLLSKKSRPESPKKDDPGEQEKSSKTKRHNINLVG